MIKRIFISVLFVSLFLTFNNAFAQSNDYRVRKCFQYERDSCPNSGNIYYKYNSESRSALFLKGQTSRFPLSIYNGRDYRISICWDFNLGNRLEFKIIDADTDNVLYDNSTDEFASEFEFTVAQSRDVYIQIKVPGTNELIKNQEAEDLIFVRKDQEMGCVGVLVEHMITPSKGF